MQELRRNGMRRFAWVNPNEAFDDGGTRLGSNLTTPGPFRALNHLCSPIVVFW
jgi:hypothetical protein